MINDDNYNHHHRYPPPHHHHHHHQQKPVPTTSYIVCTLQTRAIVNTDNKYDTIRSEIGLYNYINNGHMATQK